MRTLIVHEWLTNFAGSERVVAAMRSALPGARVATTMCWGPEFRDWDVITTPLQRLATGPQAHLRCLPLMPPAWLATELPQAERVVTSFHTFALWARVPQGAEHTVYCHTPPRFLWAPEQIRTRGNAGLTLSTRAVGGIMRYLDRRRATRRPARWIANSRFTAARIHQAYGVTPEVVYPPVDTAPYEAVRRRVTKGEHFLVFGRLVPYKRVDLVIDAFRELGLPLVIAGGGRLRSQLESSAPNNVRFLGPVTESDKPRLLAEARALVFPGEEDFGIVPVEAMAAGTPVVGFSRGGLAETVVDGVTGVFHHSQHPAAIASAVRTFDNADWDAETIALHSQQFSSSTFVANIRRLVGS